MLIRTLNMTVRLMICVVQINNGCLCIINKKQLMLSGSSEHCFPRHVMFTLTAISLLRKSFGCSIIQLFSLHSNVQNQL